MNIIKPFTTHRYLLTQLIQREIKARYKQSIIGYFWVVLNPLAQMLVYTFVFSVVFRFETTVPYPIFLFAGLLPWTLLNGVLTIATNSLVTNDILIKKVAFPREIIPYAVIFAKIIDFAFSSVLFILLMLFFKIPFSAAALLFIPLFFVQVLLMSGISLAFSTFNLFYRDIQYLMNLLLMIWMYMTPVLYPLSLVPEKYVGLYKLNPMVGLIEGYRAVLFNTPIDLQSLYWSIIVSIGFFMLGYQIFKRSEKVFADIV